MNKKALMNVMNCLPNQRRMKHCRSQNLCSGQRVRSLYVMNTIVDIEKPDGAVGYPELATSLENRAKELTLIDIATVENV